MLTPLGKYLRKLRIYRGDRLKDMSDFLGVTPSYLSAVETGKKSCPERWLDLIGIKYGLSTASIALIKKLAEMSKPRFMITLPTDTDDLTREVVAIFSRNVTVLDEKTLRKLIHILIME